MKNPILIGIAEDHPLFRKGLVSLLNEVDNIKIIFDVANGQELLEKIQTETPNIVLLDIDMPVMCGKEALKQITKNYPKIKVIMLSLHYNSSYIISFFKEGARAFLSKSADYEEVIMAINTVAVDGLYYNEEIKSIIEKQVLLENEENNKIQIARLTDREVQVLKLLRTGKSIEDIGIELEISTRTAEWHRDNLLHKLKSSDCAELISWSKKNLN